MGSGVFRRYGKTISVVALAAALTGLTLTQASAEYRQRRGFLPGGPMATGVVAGFPLGAFVAGVYRPRYSPTGGGNHEPPPVRCWWQREDIWNGYDHVPNRVRVCQ